MKDGSRRQQIPPLHSFFMGGFECSTHRLRDGRRLDLTRATHHDLHAEGDFRTLAAHGIRTVREGLRWHLVEPEPRRRDWSSLFPVLDAANGTGTQVVWDLLHFGWPDHLDIWSADFPARFAAFAFDAVTVIDRNSEGTPLFCPINEISFLAWGGGEVGYLNPFTMGAGAALKRQLVRAALAAITAIRAACPRASILHAEPAIHVRPHPHRPEDTAAAAAASAAQWEAVDMLTGRLHPELGGDPTCLDLLGLNFYPHNQWVLNGGAIPFGHHWYRPLRELIQEAYMRYHCPIVIAETGAEGAARASWLHFVAGEVRHARSKGIPVAGICIYPIVDYPGWDDGRICETGLLGLEVSAGRRRVHLPLAEELERQNESLAAPLCHAAGATAILSDAV